MAESRTRLNDFSEGRCQRAIGDKREWYSLVSDLFEHFQIPVCRLVRNSYPTADPNDIAEEFTDGIFHLTDLRQKDPAKILELSRKKAFGSYLTRFAINKIRSKRRVETRRKQILREKSADPTVLFSGAQALFPWVADGSLSAHVLNVIRGIVGTLPKSRRPVGMAIEHYLEESLEWPSGRELQEWIEKNLDITCSLKTVQNQAAMIREELQDALGGLREQGQLEDLRDTFLGVVAELTGLEREVADLMMRSEGHLEPAELEQRVEASLGHRFSEQSIRKARACVLNRFRRAFESTRRVQSSNASLQIYRDGQGQYFWRRVAPNGELLESSSLGFKSRQDAKAAALGSTVQVEGTDG